MFGSLIFVYLVNMMSPMMVVYITNSSFEKEWSSKLEQLLLLRHYRVCTIIQKTHVNLFPRNLTDGTRSLGGGTFFRGLKNTCATPAQFMRKFCGVVTRLNIPGDVAHTPGSICFGEEEQQFRSHINDQVLRMMCAVYVSRIIRY